MEVRESWGRAKAEFLSTFTALPRSTMLRRVASREDVALRARIASREPIDPGQITRPAGARDTVPRNSCAASAYASVHQHDPTAPARSAPAVDRKRLCSNVNCVRPSDFTLQYVR
jgi:hypothetical protein